MGLTWTLLLSRTLKTPDKMRALLAVALLVFVSGALAGGKEKQEMLMWMKMKAMEGCLGEQVVKDHMIKMRKSAAKCMRIETPELELPMFQNIMQTFMKMQLFPEMMDSDDSPGNYISKRAADEDAFDLGSKLHQKLEHKKEEMEEMAGNMTCMLRECQIL